MSGVGAGDGRGHVVAVIVHYGDPALAWRCLRDVRASRGVRVRTLVIDNGPSTGTDGARAFREEGAEWVSLEENAGFAGGANEGFRRACLQDDVTTIVVLNSDVRLARGCLRELDRVLEADPSIGLAGPVLLEEQSPRRCWNAGTDVEWPSGRPRSRRHGKRPPPRESGVRDVDFVCGAVLALRPDVRSRLGGFDEDYFLYYEDADLSLRARRLGLRAVVVPAARAWHAGGASFAGREAWATYFRVRNRLLFSLRWSPKPLRGRLARAAFAWRSLLRACGCFLSARAPVGRALLRAVIDHWRRAYGRGSQRVEPCRSPPNRLSP